MSTTMAEKKPTEQLPAIAPPRLPYHPGIKERFGVDQTEWRALVESTFPSARTVGAVILALAYCKARGLDPFKKMVHIVPIWDKNRKCEVETVWPGIAEYRVTAMRTGCYAGHEPIEHGPMMEQTWEDGDAKVHLKFPEWASMTAYRLCGDQRVAFPGPRVYWLETFAEKRNGAPNSMWAERPIGMIDKCAESAALRSAFPEELGSEPTYDEWGGFRWHGRDAIAAAPTTAQKVAAQLEAALPVKSEPVAEEPETDVAEAPAPESEPAAEEPEIEPEPGAESDMFDEYLNQLGEATTAAAVREVQASYADSFASPDFRRRVAEQAEIRLVNLRGPRGQRSNKAQRSMLPAGASATEEGQSGGGEKVK